MNADMLLAQLAASEVDYAEIKARRDTLALLTKPTAAQVAELADYQRKLDHDDMVKEKWLKILKLAKVATDDAKALEIRTTTIAKVRQVSQGELATIEAEIIRLEAIVIDMEKETAEIEVVDKAAQLDHWAKIKANREARLGAIIALSATA